MKLPSSHQDFKSNRWFYGLAMVLLGAVIVIAVRFALIKDTSVHYHADFALYVNGQKDEFKNFTFYEEVAACSVHDGDNVKARTHMHDQKAGLVHVHDSGVTWGQFFANLGYTLGNKVIATRSGVFVDGQNSKSISILLNGEVVKTVENQVIKSDDVLLISYGEEDAKTLQDRYAAIPKNASMANKTKDPASCSGTDELTFINRLKQAIGIKTIN